MPGQKQTRTVHVAMAAVSGCFWILQLAQGNTGDGNWKSSPFGKGK